MSKNLIEVRNLAKHFEISNSFFTGKKKIIKAVDEVSFNIKAGESLGLVGQSGCGKTTTARSLCLLEPKTSGSVNFFNPEKNIMESIDAIDEDGMRVFRRNMQMIFQDPYESLNPRWTIKDIIKDRTIDMAAANGCVATVVYSDDEKSFNSRGVQFQKATYP